MKRHYIHLRRFFCIPLLIAVLMTGCGNGSQNVIEESIQEESASPITDWSSWQITDPQNADSDSPWHLIEYHDNWITPSESDNDSQYFRGECAVYGTIYINCQYSLNPVIRSVDSFDVQNGRSYHMELNLTECDIPEDASVTDMDMTDDNQVFLLFHSQGESGTPIPYCSLLSYHRENGAGELLDLLPALTAAGKEHEPAQWSATNGYFVNCDQSNRVYLLCNNTLLVISETGELLCSMEPDPDDTLSFLCKMPDGMPIILRQNKINYTNTYWAYDHTAGEMRSLGETKFMDISHGCMDSYGNLYYFSNDRIVKWNPLSGNREKIFDCKKNHIFSNTYASKVMTIRENGDLAVMDPISDGHSIYVLSPNPPANTRTLTLVSTSQGDSIIPAAAALFSTKHPDVTIEISDFESDGGNDPETYTTNLINQIMAGDAPDMFVISAETMYTLHEKGVLADLTGCLPEDTLKQVFSCIWNAGTIDGKLTGLATDVISYGILVSDELWTQDTWSLEDILELAENAPAGTLKGILPRASSYDSSSDILYWLALRDLNPCLVDRETGACHFDSEIFRKLLEYCKNTPEPENSPEDAVKDGEYLAYAYTFYFGFSEFSTQMSMFPENYHWVGVPTDGNSGNQIFARDFLVVNKDTENMDLIQEFLPFLYGDELTRLYPNNCLRRDVLRKRVLDATEYNPNAQFDMGEGVYRQLDCKPDGTAYTEDYIAFMDSCVLEPPEDSAIASIVLEEVEPYFSGEKDMNTVIQIIQNRVQLYLDENYPYSK